MIKKIKISICFCIIALVTISCKYYSFTGISVSDDVKTFQVNFFPNVAPLIEPGLDRQFTNALQDIIVNQTSLQMVPEKGDIIYEGEITEYNVSPMSATAQQTAAQNRLTIGVNVRFINTKQEDKDFEKKFSFYYDYPATTQLNSIKETAQEEIFERITQDIINASLADW